jgi:hypothetical protein
LKKHYQVELDVLRNENAIIRKRMVVMASREEEADQSMEIMNEGIFGPRIAQAEDLVARTQWRTPDD